MAALQLETFKDILDAVCEELGIQSSDTVTRNRIKRDINIIYLEEIVPASRWWWLRKHVDLSKDTKFNTGTASVTQNSRSIVLTELPSDSWKGAWINIKGDAERYKIQDHTAGSATLTLEVAYVNATASGRTFTMWRDTVPLPPDANEVIEVTQDHLSIPMEAKGLQEMRRYIQTSALLEGRPRFYSTTDFVEPTPFDSISGLPASATRTSSGLLKSIKFASGLGSTPSIPVGTRIKVAGASHASYNTEDAIVVSVTTTTNTNDTITYVGSGRKTETSVADTGITVKAAGQFVTGERYRELLVHPSIYDTGVVLHCDYLVEAKPLENDSDEPLMPVEDRTVILYGALHRAWSKGRNPNEAARNLGLYQAKLARMQGKTEDSPDKPQIKPNQQYISRLRGASRTRLANRYYEPGLGSGGSTSSPQGTAGQVAVFDSNGFLASSTDISSTELGYLEGVTSNIQDQLDALGSTFLDGVLALTSATLTDNTSSPTEFYSVLTSAYTSLHLFYSITRGSSIMSGIMVVSTDGSNAYIADGMGSGVSVGVGLSASVSGGTLRLLYTTTSTGDDATIRFKGHRWLA